MCTLSRRVATVRRTSIFTTGVGRGVHGTVYGMGVRRPAVARPQLVVHGVGDFVAPYVPTVD